MSSSKIDKLRNFFTDIIKTSNSVRGGICTSDGLSYFSTSTGSQELDEIISLIIVGVAENAIRYGLLREAALQFTDTEIYIISIPDCPQFYAYLIFTDKNVPSEFFKGALFDQRRRLSKIL